MMQETQKPYFPPLYGEVDCSMCDIADDCRCRWKYQRSRRDFLYTSGRCPRLPDERGFVEKEHRKLYAKAFPLVHAERGSDDALFLTLTIPDEKRPKKVYRTKSGHWYFRERSEDGRYTRRCLNIQGFDSSQSILSYMNCCHTDYCLFRAQISDDYV